MIDLALDPSETRKAAVAPPRSAGRPWGRIALVGVLGLAGTGAFATVASSYLSGLAGPQRAPAALRQRAADWPDLKDGLPALAASSPPAPTKVREILPVEPARPAIVEARPAPGVRPEVDAITTPIVPPPAPRIAEHPPEVPVAKPLPAIIAAPVVEPVRQAIVVAPAPATPATDTVLAKTVRAETVRAESGAATFAALPPEPAKADRVKAEPARADTARIDAVRIEPKQEAAKPEVKAKPRIEANAKPPAAKPAIAKPAVGEKPAARKPIAVEAKAVPVEAAVEDEDTEVFGIKVPSLAPAGRKIRESVEAFGDAVKGIPGRF